MVIGEMVELFRLYAYEIHWSNSIIYDYFVLIPCFGVLPAVVFLCSIRFSYHLGISVVLSVASLFISFYSLWACVNDYSYNITELSKELNKFYN
jgi:hypothetical protein